MNTLQQLADALDDVAARRMTEADQLEAQLDAATGQREILRLAVRVSAERGAQAMAESIAEVIRDLSVVTP